ncbi:MAG: V-type ATP synthase subunit D [Candidatus Micrarchaeaceae archaeon]
MAQINPTRMNLITLKGRIEKAKKGHSILKKKRDMLVIEFLKMLKEGAKERSVLKELVNEAYSIMGKAYTFDGKLELEDYAINSRSKIKVDVKERNVMGVRIPEIEKFEEPDEEPLIYAPSSVADIKEEFSRLIDAAIERAKIEHGLRKLSAEISNTRRRVNALEHISIPKMERDEKYITMRLEEIERDMFSSLKHVKKKLEKKV